MLSVEKPKLSTDVLKCNRLGKRCGYTSSIRAFDAEVVPCIPQNVNSDITLRDGSTIGSDESGIGSTQNQVEGEMSVGTFVVRRAEFPTVYFLDSASHIKTTAEPREPGMAVPPEVLAIIQSDNTIRSLVDVLFRSIHSWLPILSQKRLLQKINDFDSDTNIGLSLLLLCMKLVSDVPSGNVATSPLYSMVKQLYFQMENAAFISFQLLQSAILIAIFEIGHGIHPAGYLSGKYNDCAEHG
jgi:hypothetical protein